MKNHPAWPMAEPVVKKPSSQSRAMGLIAIGLLLTIAWDLSGADLLVSQWFGFEQGFVWRHHWLTEGVLHDAGRWLTIGLLMLLAWDAWQPLIDGPPRGQRIFAVAVVLCCACSIPALKSISATSCPWDLVEFGGVVPYVPHWMPGASDGGPGRCFPSGHATAGFALAAAFPMWRRHRPTWARTWLSIAAILGLLFGIAQLLRGAHFVSHVLWSAWVCLLITGIATWLERWLWPQPDRQTSAGTEREAATACRSER